MRLPRLPFRPDGFTLALVATVILATVLPGTGSFAEALSYANHFGIAALFFLYGARLSGQAIRQGASQWRVHLSVFLSTFALFPLLALAMGFLTPRLLSPELYLGILFLSTLPSTVQSSVAFTSIAGGNVPAAICSASASSLISIVLTPLLATLLLSAHGASLSIHGVEAIVLQILMPFAAGHLLRPWIGDWVAGHRRVLSFFDRAPILLIVYTAFSEAVVTGLWHRLAPLDLGLLALVDTGLLAAVMVALTVACRRFGFSRSDEIAVVFCGSKKSLINGIPMATVLFAGQSVGLIVLPIMLFHQIQMFVCAALAQRYAREASRAPATMTGAAAD
jgi:sodium/bile acid cotransporter 7